MKCYICAKNAKSSDAVAICVACGMGTCMEHTVRREVNVWEGGKNFPDKINRMLCPDCNALYKETMDFQTLLTYVAMKISTTVGTSLNDVTKVIQAGVPILLGQLGNNASSMTGATQLDKALLKDHLGGSLLDNPDAVFTGGDVNVEGVKILDHVFGDNITTATRQVSQKTGVEPTTIVKIWSFIAPLVMAFLGREKATNDLDAGGVSDYLKNQKTSSGNPLTDIATAVLDKNKDGSIIDDILGMVIR